MKIHYLDENNIISSQKFHYDYMDIPDDWDATDMLDRDYQQRLEAAKPDERDNVTRCDTLQELLDRLNKETLNGWRRWDAHQDKYPKVKRLDGKAGYIKGEESDDSFDILEYAVYEEPDRRYEVDEEYKEMCDFVREHLKAEWADAFIAVHLNDTPIREYAASIGADESNISHKLTRAKKKLEKIMVSPSDFKARRR